MFIFAQARFPKPEFTAAYQHPLMDVEAYYFSDDYLKLAAYLVTLILVFFALYCLRSRKTLVVIALASVAIFGFYWKGCPCPIGLTQNTSAFLFDSNQYYPFVYFAIFSIPLLAAIFLGRIFCGGACPLGALQEILSVKNFKVPYALDKIMSLLPYLVLSIILVFAASGGFYIGCLYDPFVPIFRQAGTVGTITFAVIMVLLSIVIARPYCRYLCPYSVLLKYASFLSKKRVSIAPKLCVNCKLCEQVCPHGAIQVPGFGKFYDDPFLSKQHIARLVALLPLFLLIGTFCGYMFGMLFEQIHPTIKLLSEIKSGIKNDYTDTFYASGVSVEMLESLAHLASWKLRLGFSASGAIVALVMVLEAISSFKRKENLTYEVDMSKCLCCARCYEACPDNVNSAKNSK